MDDYISREALIKELFYAKVRGDDEYMFGTNHTVIDALMDRVNKIPSADVVEAKHGRWEEWAGSLEKCSICGYEYIDRIECRDYCGNCGAKME